jgi:hypothetical protein
VIIDLDDAWMRKLCAGAQAIGLLSAMLRVGALPSMSTPAARAIVDEWDRATADIDARIAARQATDEAALADLKVPRCH